VLDLLNVIGGAVVMLALMRWYLSLDENVTVVAAAGAAASDDRVPALDERVPVLDDPAARPTST
jgi:hypothetical protein